MISVHGVSMRYGSKVLFEDVNTTFSAGRRYGLTGPNGAGKSTFMKLLTGELTPQQGTVARPQKLGVLRRTSTRSTRSASSTPSSWATSACGTRCRSATRSTRSPT